MDRYIQIEGVVLQTFAFKEYDRILTLFTPSGLLKLFVKGKRKIYNALTTPLTAGEYLYAPGKRDLHQFFDGTILRQHIKIRDRYETLMAAEELTQGLLRSQWLGKPAPRLYALFCYFLEKMPDLEMPSRLTAAFLLKILLHEGILQLDGGCMECGSFAEKRFRGERYCRSHAPLDALFFNPEEEMLLSTLAGGRSLTSIAGLEQQKPFQEKITALFNQAFET